MLYRWMTSKIWAMLLALLVTGLTACQAATPPASKVSVTIERVVSGNTIEVNLSNQAQRVRLMGINAPLLSQKPWGTAAKEKLEALTAELPLQLELIAPEISKNGHESTNKYGYLWQGDRLINEQLIKEGQGLADTKYVSAQYERRLVRAQAYARIMAVGIWSHDAPLRTDPRDR
jgi:micrococcal nuclease